MRRCPDCGFENLDGNTYCVRCGKVFEANTQKAEVKTEISNTSGEQAPFDAPGQEEGANDLNDNHAQKDIRQNGGDASREKEDLGYNPDGYYPGGYRLDVHGVNTRYADGYVPGDYTGYKQDQNVQRNDRQAFMGQNTQYPYPCYPPVQKRRLSGGSIVAIVICSLVAVAFLFSGGVYIFDAIKDSVKSNISANPHEEWPSDGPSGSNPFGSGGNSGQNQIPSQGGNDGGSAPNAGGATPGEYDTYPQVWPDELVENYQSYMNTPVNTMGYVVQVLRDEQKGCLFVTYVGANGTCLFIVEGEASVITDQIQVGDQLDLYGEITGTQTYQGSEVPVFNCVKADILSSNSVSSESE